MSEPQPIVITDPKPLPRDARCPKCRAGADQRVESCGFGGHRPLICGVCGYEWE